MLAMLREIVFCTGLMLTAFAGGWPGVLRAADGQLELRVIDRDTGQPTVCRMHLKNAAGKPVKIPGALQHGDYVVITDKIVLRLPRGNYTFTMERGPESLIRSGHFTINRFADDVETVDLKNFCNLADEGWYGGDLDAQRPVDDLPLLMAAEGLHVVALTSWQNDKTIWNKQNPLPKTPIAEHPNHRLIDLLGGRDERHGSALGLFNLRQPLTLPRSADLWPTLAQTAATAHAERGWVDGARLFSRELPLLVAAGKLDSAQLLNRHLLRGGIVDHEADGYARDKKFYPAPFGNGRWSQHIYYQLLECGLRLPLTAGSGSGANTNPLGYNRVYAQVEGELTLEKWWAAVRAGRVMVTNGPLLRCTVEGKYPGHTFTASKGETLELLPELTLSTRDKIDYIEVVHNGVVVNELRLAEYQKSGGKVPPLTFTESGWFLLRAVTNEKSTYRHATTGPFFVEFDYQKRFNPAAARFFIDWVDREIAAIRAEEPAGIEQPARLAQWEQARVYWQKLGKRGGGDSVVE
ncbi:MAG: CehA/McbA family metallohydrolase [Pirellulales bacterium]|nr:CehA/McbA family metallohydrolase [Pirellulales bacterium]